MKFPFVLLALLFGGILMPLKSAAAADMGQRSAPAYRHRATLPFPRNARAAAVWGEGVCWQDCQRTCTWGLADCLKVDAQGRCLDYTDACDHSCQRECRTRGGPYLLLFNGPYLLLFN